MSENLKDPKYTTGEMAKLCNISVRTVQFYDTKNLLTPSELTDGGRRLYTDADLSELKLICMLKSLGCSLDSIKGILESDNRGKVLTLLLDEQSKQLNDEINARNVQLAAIKVIKDDLSANATIPKNLIADIDTIMENKKKLNRLYHKIIIAGLILAIPQWGSVAWWVIRGDWIPFAIVWPLIIPVVTIILKVLHKKRAFICAECDATFTPRFLQSIHASRSWQPVWKLTCTKCGHYGVCVEVYAKESV